MIRVRLPTHLRRLAGSGAEVTIEVSGPVTQPDPPGVSVMRGLTGCCQCRLAGSVSVRHAGEQLFE